MIESKTPFTLKWKYPTSYTFAILSWTTGLINIFHGPKLLIAVGLFNYILVHCFIMVVIGIPMTLAELAISQYSLKSVVRSWDLCPFFRGVGYGKLILVIIFQIYYNIVNFYVLFYCFNVIPAYENLTKLNNSVEVGRYESRPEKYWFTEVIRSDKPNVLVFGLLNWKLLLCFSGHIVLILIFNIKGIEFLETLLPLSFNVSILEFIILFCATNATPGGIDGIKYVIFKKVNLNIFLIWKEDGILLHVFQYYIYSMGLALGGLSSIASMGTFRKPVKAISIWVNLANLGTTVIYSLFTANFYGILQHNKIETNLEDFTEVHKEKYRFDYIFTVIPVAIKYLPGLPQLLWKTIFYSHIYLKGICVTSLMINTVFSTFYEEYSNVKHEIKSWAFLFISLITLSGFLFLTKFGSGIGQFISKLIVEVLLPIFISFEVITLVFVYGLLRFMKDLHFMLGTYPSVYWPIGLTLSILLVPLLSVISVVFYFKDTTMTELEIILLKVILSLTLVWIPFMAMVRIIRKAKLKIIFRSSRNWGPANKLKNSRNMFEKQHSVPEFLYQKYLLERKLKKYE